MTAFIPTAICYCKPFQNAGGGCNAGGDLLVNWCIIMMIECPGSQVIKIYFN